MACRERCYSDGTSTCWKHLRLKSVSRAALFDLELLWYFVVILTPHNSPLKGKRLVWSTKCLDILYCPTVFRDFPFCSCHFLLHLFNASPVPFPWQPFPYLSHGTFCRYFWILSFLVMIPDYFCRFLSWIPKIYLGSKESCHFPASHIGAVSASIILPSSLSHACPIERTIKNHPIIIYHPIMKKCRYWPMWVLRSRNLTWQLNICRPPCNGNWYGSTIHIYMCPICSM